MNVVATVRAVALGHGVVLFGAFALSRLAAKWALRRDPTEAAATLRLLKFTFGLSTVLLVAVTGVLTGLFDVLARLIEQIPGLGSTALQQVTFYTSVLFGPLLGGYLVVSLAMLPAWRRLKDIDLSARSAVRNETRRYVARTGPTFGLVMLALTLPPGPIVALGAATTYAVYATASPWIFGLLNDTRALDPAERDGLGAIAERDVPVRIVDASDAKHAQGVAVGVVPGARRVYLTDYLVDELATEEVRAVAEHEFAHLWRGHNVLRVASFGLLVVGMAVAIADPSSWSFALAAAIGIAYWLVVAGVARWTEYDADRAAADAEGAAAMAGALDTIAERNLLPREHGLVGGLFSKHPTIDRRMRELEERRQSARPTRAQGDTPLR